MSAIGRPLPGVKQTWRFADVCFCGRYWGQSGHGLLRRTCLLMTQSGHRRQARLNFYLKMSTVINSAVSLPVF